MAAPVSVVKGEGVYLWDVEGKKYYDYNAGSGTMNTGHCHPKVYEAMCR